jgi:transcriptional regulator with XRE-family HTH domain
MKLKTLAQRLRFERDEMGWTQADLSRISGINSMQISHFESSRRLPCVPNAIKLCEALGCSMDWLTRGIRCGHE